MKFTEIRLVVLCFAVAIVGSGCSSSKPRKIDSTYSAQGNPIKAVSCDGKEKTIDDCHHEAGKICGSRGFEVFTTKKEQVKATDGTQVWKRTVSFSCI